MFGAIPAEILLSIARSTGAYHQLELDLDCPPWVFVKPEFLASLQQSLNIIGSSGKRSGMLSSVDHPSFLETRKWLGKNGYISIEDGWVNGDRVTKPFYFNNVYMDAGDKFACAPAMKYKFGKPELYNNGEPLPIPNYFKEERAW